MGEVASLLRNARNLAIEKQPLENPLIVKTGYYTHAVEEKEILGVAIKAPFGSGKTFGIALKSYHDSRLGQYPMENTKVVALCTRELLYKDKYFDELVKEPKNIMCGGLLVSALKYVSTRHERCTHNNDTSCYTTLRMEEAEDIATLLKNDKLSRKLEKGVTADVLAELLRSIKHDILRDKDLVVIIDEVEGFLTRLNLRASDVVYSNLAMMAKMHDQGIWGIKLIMLLQSRVIDDDWNSIINRIKEGRPYVSRELRSIVPSEASVYVCPITKERLDVSALMGRVRLLSMDYYSGNVYAEYTKLALEKVSNFRSALSEDIAEIANKYINDLMDFFVSDDVSERLTFLRFIAPRISFDYMDELIENMLRTRKSKVRDALDTALHNVAKKWSRYDDIRRFYSKIIIKKIPKQRSAYKNISVFKLVSIGDYSKIIETLTKDLYLRVIKDMTGREYRLDPRSIHYHSNHVATVSCLVQNELFTGVLVLRTTTSKPPKGGKERNFVKQLAEHISALIKLTTDPIIRVQHRNVNLHRIIGLMLVPEETSSTSYLELERLLVNIMNTVRSKMPGKPTRIVSMQPVLKIKDEDFIIIAEKTLEKEQGVSVVNQFVDERYKDILAWLAGKVKANIDWGV